jgi:hypothetical protein
VIAYKLTTSRIDYRLHPITKRENNGTLIATRRYGVGMTLTSFLNVGSSLQCLMLLIDLSHDLQLLLTTLLLTQHFGLYSELLLTVVTVSVLSAVCTTHSSFSPSNSFPTVPRVAPPELYFFQHSFWLVGRTFFRVKQRREFPLHNHLPRHKDIWWSRGTCRCILNLETRWRCVLASRHSCFNLRERAPGMH